MKKVYFQIFSLYDCLAIILGILAALFLGYGLLIVLIVSGFVVILCFDAGSGTHLGVTVHVWVRGSMAIYFLLFWLSLLFTVFFTLALPALMPSWQTIKILLWQR